MDNICYVKLIGFDHNLFIHSGATKPHFRTFTKNCPLISAKPQVRGTEALRLILRPRFDVLGINAHGIWRF